ncbi:MAG: TetR/AcrR family transcriptional regulator [Pseudomonadota bacterium]
MNSQDGHYSFRSTKGAQTHASLLDAAFALIAEGGIYDLTIAKVCDATGLKRSSFYTHFRDMDDLIGALSIRVLDEFGPGHIDADAHSGENKSVLKARLDFVFAEIERRPALGHVIHELVAFEIKSFEAVMERVLSDVRQDIRKGVLSIRRDDAPAFAHAISATVVSLLKMSKSKWKDQLDQQQTVGLLLRAGGLKEH